MKTIAFYSYLKLSYVRNLIKMPILRKTHSLHRLNVMAHPFTQFVRHYTMPGQRAHVAFSRALSELLMLKPTGNHRPRISTVYPGQACRNFLPCVSDR